MDATPRWLATLFLAALTMRMAALAALPANRARETAHHEHESIARNLATDRGFRFNFFGDIDNPDLTSQQAPLVPYLLAGCYRLFGVESPIAMLVMQVLQACFSALTVVLLAQLAGTLAASSRSRAATMKCTGALAVVYPPLVIGALHIQALVWNLGWLTLMLVGTQWLRQLTPKQKVGEPGAYRGEPGASATGVRNPTSRRGVCALALGGIGGLLTDPILGLPLVLLLALLLVEHRSRYGARVAIVAALVVAAIAPWLVRNHRVHGRFVFIKDSFGYVFWQGNNLHSQGTDKLLVEPRFAETIRAANHPFAADGAALAARRRAVSVDRCLSADFIRDLQALPREIDRMDRFQALAWQAIAGDPAHYLKLCGQRFWFWIWFDETNPRSFLWHYRATYGLLTIMGAMSLPTVWRCRDRWRPVWLVALGLTAVHVLIITSARFRIPMELLLLLPAGHTMSRMSGAAWTLARGVVRDRMRRSIPRDRDGRLCPNSPASAINPSH